MQDNSNNDTQRQGYPASDQGGSQPPAAGAGETRQMDTSGAQPMIPGGFQPTQSPQWSAPNNPQQPPQWGAPGQTQQFPPYNQPPMAMQQQMPQQPPYNQYQPVATPAGAPPWAALEANPVIKDSTTAMIVEMAAGLIGLLGVGHILSGRVVPGLLLLVGWWVFWGFFFGIFALMTLGFGCFCAPIFWLAGPIASGLWLKQEFEKRWGRRIG